MSTTLSREGNFQFPMHLLTGSLERRTEQRYVKANNSNITVGLFFPDQKSRKSIWAEYTEGHGISPFTPTGPL